MAVSSPRTGMTIRILTDHRTSPVSVINCTRKQVRGWLGKPQLSGQEAFFQAVLLLHLAAGEQLFLFTPVQGLF